MTLTTIIKSSEPNHKKFKAILKEFTNKYVNFKTESGKLVFSNEYNLLLPIANYFRKGYDFSILGMAFDYLARFLLALNLKTNSFECLDKLAAEIGLISLTTKYADNFKKPDELIEGFEGSRNFLKMLLSRKKNLTSQELKDVCLIFCFYARLECAYRGGIVFERVSSYFQNEKFLEELIPMAEIFSDFFLDSKFVKKAKNVVYNPMFGFGSTIVNADADLWIDGTLFDFKTSYKYQKKSNDILQLVGYFLLNEVNRYIIYDWAEQDLESENGEPVPQKSLNFFKECLLDIKRIAFYRARYGEIEYCDLSKVDKKVIKQYAEDIFKWWSEPLEANEENLKS